MDKQVGGTRTVELSIIIFRRSTKSRKPVGMKEEGADAIRVLRFALKCFGRSNS